jgi:hypothetical protein
MFRKQRTARRAGALRSVAACVLLTFFGCESTPHYDRTKVVILGPVYPKKPYGSVKLFQGKESVTGAYDVIALMTVDGSVGDEAAFLKAFLYRAADLGADAVIAERVSVVSGTGGGGWIANRNGGFGLPLTPQQNAFYRGEAIHFK